MYVRSLSISLVLMLAVHSTGWSQPAAAPRPWMNASLSPDNEGTVEVLGNERLGIPSV